MLMHFKWEVEKVEKINYFGRFFFIKITETEIKEAAIHRMYVRERDSQSKFSNFCTWYSGLFPAWFSV